jgi:polysaccharide export outer membrane protein
VGGEAVRVSVLEVGKFFVFGNIKKPGTLPLSDDATVFKAIALSEGLAPNAAKEAFIFRREAGLGSRNEIPVDLKKIMDRKAPDVALMADDILYIPENVGRRDTLAVAKVVGTVALVALTAAIYLAIR